MKVSIIILTYNSEQNIKHCIDSIKKQTYKDIEYIIIDGLSSDNTIKIIDENRENNTILISEKDNGIYDAWNKGLKRASGDIVGTVMSDDYLNDQDSIQSIVNIFKEKKCDIVYGNMQFELNNKIVRQWKAGKFNKKKYYLGWMPPPPTVYVKNTILKENETFDEKYKIAADYEWLLRIFFMQNYNIYYFDRFFYTLRMGGVSNKNLINIIKSNRECYQAWVNNKISKFPFWIFFKPFFKILQITSFNSFLNFYKKSK